MRVIAGRADPKVVRQQLAGYLAESGKLGLEPVNETWRFYRLMEDRVPLGLDTLSQWAAAAARTRFQTQVLRELNLLAGKGVLVKRGDRKDLRFYTPAAAKAVDEAKDSAQRQRAERRTAEGVVRDRLAALGCEPLVQSGAGVRLDLEDWERLLNLAEKGKGK